MMEKVVGTKVNDFTLFNRLRKVRDLIVHEQAYLSHWRSDTGEHYLEMWCDKANDFERWLLFQVDDKSLQSYIEKRTTLKDIISHPRDGFLYVLDRQAKSAEPIVQIISPTLVPSVYIPAADSYYEFIPEYTEVGATYSLSIDRDWSLEDLKRFPHDYSQIYSFFYAFKKLVQTHVSKLEQVVNSYPWKGGFSSMHFYQQLKALVPERDMPEIHSMHYASPGWIELELFRPAAMESKTVIEGYISTKEAIDKLISEIYEELRKRKLVGSQGKEIQDRISQDDLDYCTRAYTHLSRMLGFEEFSALQSVSMNSLASLKILLSLVRRIRRLASFSAERKVTF
jgi:hypothetical protein